MRSGEVWLAMGTFVLSHVLIARTRIRPALVARLGEGPYLAAYSMLSLVLLGWVIRAVLRAERVQVWSPPPWGHLFAAVMSFLAFLLIGVAIVTPNPVSVAFRKGGFDPCRPGVIGWVRHPLVWGLTLWGVAHIPANGDWPSLLLFAGAALFGVAGIFGIERRLARRLGGDELRRLMPSSGHVDRNLLIGVVLGAGLWVGFLVLHPTLFGAHPLAVIRAQLSSGTVVPLEPLGSRGGRR